MVRKYSILFGMIMSATLLLVAARRYPGGSQYDKNSIGYNWKTNCLDSLVSNKAINGSADPSGLWAICGIFFLLNK